MTKEKQGWLKSLVWLLSGYTLASIIASISIFATAAIVVEYGGSIGYIVYEIVVVCAFMSLWVYQFSKKGGTENTFLKANLIYAGVLSAVFTAVFVISGASVTNSIIYVPLALAFPFIPIGLLSSLYEWLFQCESGRIYTLQRKWEIGNFRETAEVYDRE